MNKTVKTVIIAILILGAMAGAFALGSSGRMTMMAGSDRLVGILITTQALPDDKPVYAEFTDGEYMFKDVEGIQCFISNDEDTVVLRVDDALTNVSSGLHMTDDDQESVSLSAKLYLSTRFNGIIYPNHVYMTASGEIYAVGSSGIEYTGDVGAGGSFSIADSTKIYENGKTVIHGINVNVDVEIAAVPEKIIVFQYGSSGELLSSESFEPGQLPESMESGAAYIVVGTVSQSGTEYELFRPDDEDISALYCRADGICAVQYCDMSWK